ncbi:type 4a pilus biogenesis protein PilO [Aquabacterium sp. A7-Y]|uniref:hypothetical protein n=1 Tax=Aquabacterium sp. A7-Y TaxID=1349605 RepID=UPI00223E7B39|nr:hypothetical protein [Aquabacterium sp. A7-Y]MCW7537686.1 type 4a pilus biogenesis protein PilO [Aquabacterium sp. A7-Y]
MVFALAGAAYQLPRLRAQEADLHVSLEKARQRPALPVRAVSPPSLLTQLPSEAELPALLAQIVEAARLQEVPLGQSDYSYLPAEAGTPPRLQLRLDTLAPYAGVRRFVNQVVLTQPAVALTGFSTSRESDAQPVPRVRLVFEVYYRSAP